MKLLHTSDWHLGAVDGERSLWEDQKYFIDAICALIEKKEIDAVLLAGDVYDRSVASAKAIELYDYAMTEICGRLGREVLTIAGNHDSAERLGSCSSLLCQAGLHVRGALTAPAGKVELADTDVYLIPWITEEKVRSLYPEEQEKITGLTEAYQVVCDHVREEFVPGRRHIALVHAYLIDAETSVSDRAAEIGTAKAVAASAFETFDYVALGHIHKPQNIGTNLRYCGTPMPYSFGKEEQQEKSVTILDTETMEREIIPLPQLHSRRTLTGTYEELLHDPVPEEIRDGYLRLEVNDSYVALVTISMLRSRYPNVLEIIGKAYEDENSGIRMSMREFREMESDPMEIFRHFCRETASMDTVDTHLEELFAKAMEDCEKEVTA